MKCMRVDNRYPESIGRIVEELEKRLIELYAKVGEKLHEIRTQQELDDERESQFTNSKSQYRLRSREFHVDGITTGFFVCI